MSEAAAEAARTRVAACLEPLSPEPCGVAARDEPEHESVREEVGKLESPGAPPVEWQKVSKQGTELLSKRSKDLLIAAYTAHALFEQEGVAGLAAGLFLVSELIDRYWDGLFPPLKRIRARSNAMAWLLERAAIKLAETAPSAGDREALAFVAEQVERLASALQQRLDDKAPAASPLREAVARAQLALPEAAAAPEAPTPATAAGTPAPAQPPVDAEQPGSPHQAGASPDGNAGTAPPVATDAATAPPAGAEPDANAAAGDAAPAETPPVDAGPSLEARVAELATEFLEPISEEAPAGVDARHDETYEAIRESIKRLDMPTGGEVEWKIVLRDGSELLTKRSKDLLMASHVAYALFDQRGLVGLATGFALLSGLLRKFWDGLFPGLKRGTRARSGALAWLLSRLENIAEHPVTEADREAVDLLEAALDDLAAAIDELFDDNRPALGAVREGITRLRLAVPVPQNKPPAATPQAGAGATSTAAQPAAAARPEASVAQPSSASVAVPTELGPAPEIANKAELNKFFTRLRGQLQELATALRKANDRDPLCYRMSRVATYLTLVEEPPNNGGTTPLPAPATVVVDEVKGLLAKEQWDRLLAVAEGSVRKSPFLLDLHRYVYVAMEQLGAAYTPAQRAVAAEVGSLLARAPGLPQLRFTDGTPFADDATRSWLGQLGGSKAGTASGTGGADDIKGLAEAAAMAAAGKTAEALAEFQKLQSGLAGGRQRFLARLSMARACMGGGTTAMARAMFEGLVEDMDRQGLEEWEPSLASECLASYHQCLRGLAKTDKEMAQSAALVYRRLCRVDPQRALTEGT